MNINKKYISHMFTVFTGGLSITSFCKNSLGKDAVISKLETQSNKNVNLLDKINESLDKNITDLNIKAKFISKTDELRNIRHHNSELLNRMVTKYNDLKNTENLNNDSILSKIQNELNNLSNEINKENLVLDDLLTKIANDSIPNDIIESGIGSELFNNISNFISNYTKYLDTLNTIELGALSNLIFTLVSIFSSLTSIFIIFFSDYFIKRLDLSNYPKIKQFLELRRKFQVYYFTFNCLMIFVGILALLLVNILLFLNY